MAGCTQTPTNSVDTVVDGAPLPLHVSYMFEGEKYEVDCNYWMKHEVNIVFDTGGASAVILPEEDVEFFNVTPN